MQYDIHTNKTTPYWNCPTRVLKGKDQAITDMIRYIYALREDQLDFVIATHLVGMLKELRTSVRNQIAYREEK